MLPCGFRAGKNRLPIVKQIGSWLRANGESIYRTRPWSIFGEGPSATNNEKGTFGGQPDVQKQPLTAKDIRFTTSKDGRILYAILLSAPQNGSAVIKSLSQTSPYWPGKISDVRLVNGGQELKFNRIKEALQVVLPSANLDPIATRIRITGD